MAAKDKLIVIIPIVLATLIVFTSVNMLIKVSKLQSVVVPTEMQLDTTKYQILKEYTLKAKDADILAGGIPVKRIYYIERD